MSFHLLLIILFGFMRKLASHLERSPLIHSYGYEYDGRPALALRARLRITSCNSPVGPHFVRSNLLQANLVAHANLLQANLSAGDSPTWLLVSSMRLTPDGACAINLSRRFIARLFVSFMRLTPSGLTRYFVPDKILPLKSKSLMQYPG